MKQNEILPAIGMLLFIGFLIFLGGPIAWGVFNGALDAWRDVLADGKLDYLS